MKLQLNGLCLSQRPCGCHKWLFHLLVCEPGFILKWIVSVSGEKYFNRGGCAAVTHRALTQLGTSSLDGCVKTDTLYQHKKKNINHMYLSKLYTETEKKNRLPVFSTFKSWSHKHLHQQIQLILISINSLNCTQFCILF